MVLRVAVVGAPGRMGRLATRLIEDAPDLEVAAALGSADPIDGIAGADVVLDLTAPAASPGVVDAAIDRGIPALVGTSGWTAERIAGVEARLRALPDLGVVIVPNFSLGSVLATRFATLAATWFDSIEIIEAHHAAKTDSPSGTAIRTAEAMAAARTELGPVEAPHVDQRARGQQVSSVPIHSIRMAGVSARQTVYFGGTGERLTLDHEAFGEQAYAAGIRLALNAVTERTGVTVGLDQLIDLGTR